MIESCYAGHIGLKPGIPPSASTSWVPRLQPFTTMPGLTLVILKAKQNFADVEILFLQKMFLLHVQCGWLKPQPGLYEQVPSALRGSILGHSCCKLFGTWRWGHRHCLPSDSKALSASDGHGCVCVFLISLSNKEGSFEINFHDSSHSRMAPDFLLSGHRNTGEKTGVGFRLWFYCHLL